MTKQFVFFILMFAAFSMKRKRTANAKIQIPNAKFRTPLLKKDTWSTVNGFLLPQNEKKFKEIHKSFSQFPTKFKNISKDIKKKLRQRKVGWLFFKHLETQKMFAQNADEKNKSEQTALHCAVRCNEVEIAKAVIEAGVDIDAKDADGLTALHSAVLKDHLEIGKMLVDAGADLKIKSKNSKSTALELAELYNHGAFAEMLRKEMRWHFFKYFELQKIFAENFYERNEYGQTALHCAEELNEVEIAKTVIEAGVDIDAKDDDGGYTALHSAALNDHLEFGKVLVDAGADLKIKSDQCNSTALELAKLSGHGVFAEMLRKKMKN